MNRRNFIKSGVLSATGILLAAKFSPAQVAVKPRKVLIIGAGLSGLVAAYELGKLGFDVNVLEAQSRAGGRVLTVRDFDENLYAEAGAARIPVDHDLTLKYVREFNLPLIPFYPTEQKFMRLYNGKVEQVGWDKFADVTAFVMTLENQKHWHKIKGGNDLLPRSFAERLKDKIRYDSPVVKIEQSNERVQVTFSEKGKLKTLAGDLLICAIPATMLANIEVSPAFSEAKTEAIKTLKYDSASRVMLQTKRRFWLDRKLNGFAFGDEFAEIWHSTYGQSGTRGILQTYLRGEYSLALTKRAEPERIETTLGNLKKIFPELRANYEKGFTKCWSEDAWVRGAWAHTTPKQVEAMARPENRVFFAGEHASDYASWMQGALQSGLRVVEEIKGKNSLSFVKRVPAMKVEAISKISNG